MRASVRGRGAEGNNAPVNKCQFRSMLANRLGSQIPTESAGWPLARKWNHGYNSNGGDSTERIVLTTHSTPGTATAIDARSGEITGAAELEDNAPEGAVSDGKGRLFVNNERKYTIQVIDQKTMKAMASWPLAPCAGPTSIAYDCSTRRIVAGCSGTSVVVDALGWDPAQKLIYIPAGRDGTVTVVHQDSADQYTTLATVPMMSGARTIAVDAVQHRV